MSEFREDAEIPTHEPILTAAAPQPRGHYSQAVRFGNLLFISGQLPIDPAGNVITGTIGQEAAQALENLRAIVEAAGGTLASVVQCTIYISDIAHWAEVNGIYGAFFAKVPVPPARAIVPVKEMHYDSHIEIQAIALLGRTSNAKQRGRYRAGLLGMVLGIAGMVGFVYWYFTSGRVPVAVTSADMPFERTFVRTAMRAYMRKLPHPEPQVPADEKNLLEGAKVYKDNCAVCHGVPDAPMMAIPQGMAPKPPQLFKGIGVTDDPPWRIYWKVEGGIRMTGMPGFKDALTEPQIWQVTQLVKNADQISASVKSELTAGSVVVAPGTDRK